MEWHFSPEFIFSMATYVIGGIIFIAINSFRIGSAVRDLEARMVNKDELKDKIRERNEKIDRVYQRFDEHKRFADDMFVRRDMCGQLHLNTKDEIKKLDEDYKAFRHEIRNTVQQIFDKIDELRNLITELRK